ncbi:MAG TPA: hypothetical protein VF905_02975 [Nitrospirota bacterium]
MATPEETYRAEGRSSLLHIAPENLVVVKDPDHPLFDKESNDSLLDEKLILNMMQVGVTVPILIRKNGCDKKGVPIIEVVAGRRRTRHLLEANKRLKAAGYEVHLMPCKPEKGTDGDLIAKMAGENQFRLERGLMSAVNQAKRMLANGKDREYCASVLGVSTHTIMNYEKILDCCKEVQDAINNGVISAEAAKKLHKMSTDEQKAALKNMVDEGLTKGRAAVEAAKAASRGERPRANHVNVVKLRKRVHIEWIREPLAKHPVAVAAVNYILGDDKAFDGFPEIRAAVGSGPAKGKKGPRSATAKKAATKKASRVVEEVG